MNNTESLKQKNIQKNQVYICTPMYLSKSTVFFNNIYPKVKKKIKKKPENIFYQKLNVIDLLSDDVQV